MGLGGLHLWHLLILALIVMVVFGTKKLKHIGEDVGGAIQGFRKAMDQGKAVSGATVEKPSSNEIPGSIGTDR